MKKITTNTKLPYKYFLGEHAREQRKMVYDSIKKELELPENELIKIYEGSKNLYLTTNGWQERIMVINLNGGFFQYTIEQKEKIKNFIIEVEEAKKLREDKEREIKLFNEKYKSVTTTDAQRFFLGDTQYEVKVNYHYKRMNIYIHNATWEQRYLSLLVDLNKINEPNHGILPMSFKFGETSIDNVIKHISKMREVENKFNQFFNQVILPKLLAIEQEQIQLA